MSARNQEAADAFVDPRSGAEFDVRNDEVL